MKVSNIWRSGDLSVRVSDTGDINRNAHYLFEDLLKVGARWHSPIRVHGMHTPTSCSTHHTWSVPNWSRMCTSRNAMMISSKEKYFPARTAGKYFSLLVVSKEMIFSITFSFVLIIKENSFSKIFHVISVYSAMYHCYQLKAGGLWINGRYHRCGLLTWLIIHITSLIT